MLWESSNYLGLPRSKGPFPDVVANRNPFTPTFTPAPQYQTSMSILRWVLDLGKDGMDNQQEISLVHCKAHTNDTMLPANLNGLVDHLTSQSHQDMLSPPPPTLPPPTFTIDDLTLHSPSHGFIESNTFTFIDTLLFTSASVP